MNIWKIVFLENERASNKIPLISVRKFDKVAGQKINKIVFLYSCSKDLEMEIVGNISLATVIHTHA